jgi:HD-GYP domain-containing protein (c-di-GMP phosphodiesterase class II)
MKNHQEEVIGVLQLINAKKHRAAKLTSLQVTLQEVIPFSKRSQDLAASLASQAGVALENNLLYRDIQNLFEGFVKASVTAIEWRDPTTLGHSERVAKLTVGLAEMVDRTDTGPYKDIHFTRQDIQELRFSPPRFRQDRGARGSAEKSQETVPITNRAHPGALRYFQESAGTRGNAQETRIRPS